MLCSEPAVAGKKKKKTMKQADMDSLFASVGTEAAPSAPLENGALLPRTSHLWLWHSRALPADAALSWVQSCECHLA